MQFNVEPLSLGSERSLLVYTLELGLFVEKLNDGTHGVTALNRDALDDIEKHRRKAFE